MCAFCADIGGILQLVFDEEGNLEFRTACNEDDLLYDDIGSGLKIKELRQKNEDLLRGLELYYKVILINWRNNMIITIDVGNTNITVGVFNGDEIVASFRMTTKMPRTSDEYGMLLTNLLEQNRIHCDEIQDAIIASVVPNVMHSLEGAVIKYLNIRPIVIEPGTKTGIRIVTENPRQIGADRIVDAAAAYEIYGGPVLVLDFGTATTYDLVDATGAFVSGVTAPGIRISAKALWEDAAKLPEIEIKKPDSILAKETITSMQAGLVYGQIGQTEYIVRHMKEEANLGEIKVVATGGLGRIIASETSMIDVYDPNLTLKGMNLIYKNRTANQAGSNSHNDSRK